MLGETRRIIIIDTVTLMLKSLSTVALDAISESLVEMMEDAVTDPESRINYHTMHSLANIVRETIELEATG